MNRPLLEQGVALTHIITTSPQPPRLSTPFPRTLIPVTITTTYVRHEVVHMSIRRLGPH